MVHDSDWAVAVFVDGLVTLENVEDLEIEPRHMRGVSAAVRALIGAMAAGRIDEVFAAYWCPGYGA